MKKSKILFIDDNKTITEKFKTEFSNKYKIYSCKTIDDAENLIKTIDDIAVIISDYKIPNVNGIEFFEKIKDLFHNSVRIFLTSIKDFNLAVEAVNRCYIFRFHLIPWHNKVLEQSISDATELYWKQKNIYTRAISDSLTGLLNRGRIIEKLENELSRAKRYGSKLSVIMFDIDHFKSVNDNFGHQIGDIAIKECADTFLDSKRDVDFVGRYGGEEFLLILPETNAKNAKILCERIRVRIESANFIVENLKITISSGISEYTSGIELIELIDQADKALYKAKENGRNRIEIYQ